MKVEVNVPRRWAYAVLIMLLFGSGIFAVWAYKSNYTAAGTEPVVDVAKLGHSPNEIEVDLSGTPTTGVTCTGKMTLQSAIANKCLGAGTTGSGGTGGGGTNFLKSYSQVFSTKSTISPNPATTWVDSGLQIAVTPSVSGSKFLISANIIAKNGNQLGDCFVGLFRGNTELVAPFSANDGSNWDVTPQTISYIDTATDTSSRTYKIKVRGGPSGSYCAINRAPGSSPESDEYYGASTMTIVEFSEGGSGGSCIMRGGAWTGTLAADTLATVTFSLPFPAGVTPVVTVTPDISDAPTSTTANLVVKDVTVNGFKFQSQDPMRKVYYVAHDPAACFS